MSGRHFKHNGKIMEEKISPKANFQKGKTKCGKSRKNKRNFLKRKVWTKEVSNRTKKHVYIKQTKQSKIKMEKEQNFQKEL